MTSITFVAHGAPRRRDTGQGRQFKAKAHEVCLPNFTVSKGCAKCR
jgi:hypothetical protein